MLLYRATERILEWNLCIMFMQTIYLCKSYRQLDYGEMHCNRLRKGVCMLANITLIVHAGRDPPLLLSDEANRYCSTAIYIIRITCVLTDTGGRCRGGPGSG